MNEPPSITLTDDELVTVTGGYRQAAAQLKELHRQGFYRARRAPITGRVILERAHYDAVTAGGIQPANNTAYRPKVRA